MRTAARGYDGAVQQPKKIALVITKSNWGGAQRYVYDLASGLPQVAYSPFVILGGEGVLKDRLIGRGVRTISLPALERDVHLGKDVRTFFELRRLLKAEKPDIVHLNSSKIGGLGALAARLAGVPRIVYTAHGWAFNEPRPGWQKALIKFVYWVTMLLAHETITVSEAMRAQVSRFPLLRKKVHVVHNGIAPAHLLTRDAAAQELARLRPVVKDAFGESPVIGCVAELHRIKGLDTLIDAAAILRTRSVAFSIVIIGEGDERPALEALIKRLALENNVHLAGFVPDAARYLPAFDIFALPSRSEGFAFAVLEAGLATLPVVASKVGGIPEIITDGVHGALVAPNTPLKLADALERYLLDPTLRVQAGQRLKERVISDFLQSAMIEKTAEVYEDR